MSYARGSDPMGDDVFGNMKNAPPRLRGRRKGRRGRRKSRRP